MNSIKKSHFKVFVKEILKELLKKPSSAELPKEFGLNNLQSTRFWMNTDADIFGIGRLSHPVWAEKYIDFLGIDKNKEYAGHPQDLLYKLGWVRIIDMFDHNNDGVLAYEHTKPLTLNQDKMLRRLAVELGVDFLKNRTGKYIQVENIIKEFRGMSSGEWVEPSGNVHNVDSDSHWEWADKYLSGQEHRFANDPKEELLKRGWLQIMYSYNESLIMVTHYRQLTKQQKQHLENQSEETSWAVYNDDGKEVYRPYDCITPENALGESHALGYSHNVSSDIKTMERDTLNDPRLVKEVGEYKFHDFNWLSNMSGFGKPTDVYYGSVLLGVIISKPNGYYIERVMGPRGTIPVSPDALGNLFKTKQSAAEILHLLWKQQRTKR